VHVKPVNVWSGKHGFLYIDHHWKHHQFATSSVGIQVWDYTRSEPIHSYEWGADSVTTVRFNPAEVCCYHTPLMCAVNASVIDLFLFLQPSLLASTGADRSICLYDVRTDSALRKVVLSMNSNALAWNPREPFNFTVANEDSNLYTFDMRKIDHALNVHKDHVAAVMDVHYSPTGKEFVSGSYDRTIRIWKADQGKSREIYHAKRMQRVFSVRFTPDAKYILSGSDDTNVRLWKAQASAPLARTMPRERAKLDYLNALKKRYAFVPEVRNILQQRHVPKSILKGKQAKFVSDQKNRKRLANIRGHTKPGSKEGMPEAERSKHIVKEFK
jgi:WD repeat and SOF domain-containing protein 1